MNNLIINYDGGFFMLSNLTREDIVKWMEQFKTGWVEKRKDTVLQLFEKTEKYYERPFKPGTTMEEIETYWHDIDELSDITLDYDIVAIDGNTVCVHWDNKYSYNGENYHLDGIYTIIFNDNKECVEFHQWWFMEPKK